ncbi:MAG: hypothetical protein F6J93_20795 [Oscillatoria sp. SIO1A7]|nr:hypothetical protein [Oscillatoria sp. SIO1A7]
MKITVKDLEELIKTAIESGADTLEVQDLQEHLYELKSGQLLMDRRDITFQSETVEPDGTKVICFSTTPFSPEDDDDFEGVTFRKIKSKN